MTDVTEINTIDNSNQNITDNQSNNLEFNNHDNQNLINQQMIYQQIYNQQMQSLQYQQFLQYQSLNYQSGNYQPINHVINYQPKILTVEDQNKIYEYYKTVHEDNMRKYVELETTRRIKEREEYENHEWNRRNWETEEYNKSINYKRNRERKKYENDLWNQRNWERNEYDKNEELRRIEERKNYYNHIKITREKEREEYERGEYNRRIKEKEDFYKLEYAKIKLELEEFKNLEKQKFLNSLSPNTINHINPILEIQSNIKLKNHTEIHKNKNVIRLFEQPTYDSKKVTFSEPVMYKIIRKDNKYFCNNLELCKDNMKCSKKYCEYFHHPNNENTNQTN